MEMNILEEIGLTKTESKIYLALLKLGQTTTTNIVRESGVHASKVYEFLDRLISKGLVSHVIKSNKKYFSASEPSALKEFLKEKKKQISQQEEKVENILPQLKAIQKSRKDIIKSETYEGLNGAKSVYEKILDVLNKSEVQYVIGAPKIGNELLEGYLLEWHKRRIKKGIHCRYIYDSNAREYGSVREKMKFTEVKYLPDNIVSPMWIEVFENNVLIGHIKGKNTVLFLIEDKEIAKGYLDYFKLIWKISIK
jgi:sugar-specific transcriptional regulator TrmB